MRLPLAALALAVSVLVLGCGQPAQSEPAVAGAAAATTATAPASPTPPATPSPTPRPPEIISTATTDGSTPPASQPQPEARQPAPTAGAATQNTAPPPASQSSAIPLPPGTAPGAPTPWRLRIPAIGVDAPIVALGLDSDGAFAAPETPDVVGWYRHGPAPGQTGNVLLDGHVDWTNRQTGVPFGGVFYSLSRLGVGQQIIVTDGAQEVVYAVSERRRYHWLDPGGVSVMQPTNDARLTLITCGGVFDRASRSYDQRDVVIARRVG